MIGRAIVTDIMEPTTHNINHKLKEAQRQVRQTAVQLDSIVSRVRLPRLPLAGECLRTKPQRTDSAVDTFF